MRVQVASSKQQPMNAAEATPITLAIPYYSGFALTLRTLESIAAQSYPGVRVLIVDDSPAGLSERERAELTRSLAGKYPLRVLHNPHNLGMARTWNRCLDEADSDLVTIVHGDDELEPSYAAQMVELARLHPDAAVVFSGARVIGAHGRAALSFPDLYKELLVPRHGDTLRLSGDAGLHSILRGNYLFCPALCYRRSALASLRFDPRFRMVLDMDLTARVLLAGKQLVGVPKQRLYRYRRHADNATERLTKELTRFSEESAFYLELAREAERVGFARAQKTARGRRIIALNLLFCVARDLGGRELGEAQKKLALFRQLFLR